MTDTAFNTVLKFVVDMGKASATFLDEVMVDIPSRRIQCDEIWQFCYAKEKNVPETKRPQRTWTTPACRAQPSGGGNLRARPLWNQPL